MRKYPTLPIILAVFLIVAVQTSAQIAVGPTDEDRTEFAGHRTALFERLGDNTAVLFGAYEGAEERFRQDSNFYYLTGVEIPFAALILDGRKDKATLFLPPARTGRAAVYLGASLGPGPEAVAEFGIADVRPLDQLEPTLKELVPESAPIWTALAPERPAFGPITELPWASSPSQSSMVRDWLGKALPGVEIKDIRPEIEDLRRVKTAWEIERLTEACRIAGEGHLAAMRATHPGVMEYEIEAAATQAFLSNGALRNGYSAIVGAGPNNNVLHYPQSSDRVDDGELLLMDFGPDYRYYISDITRTWPVNGKFSPEQRKVYLQVLEIQKKLFDFIKPGVTLGQVYEEHRRLSTEMGYAGNYFHGPSHYLGMDVHDVGAFLKPLEPGVVITVEPGLYFPDKGWGIRIEDDVVVTKDGCRVLSDMIPKLPDEIEAIMAGKR